MQRIRTELTRIINGLRENPDKMIADYRETYPGITDAEARDLAASFIGLFEPHKKNRAQMQREYKKQLDTAAKKYPGSKRTKKRVLRDA